MFSYLDIDNPVSQILPCSRQIENKSYHQSKYFSNNAPLSIVLKENKRMPSSPPVWKTQFQRRGKGEVISERLSVTTRHRGSHPIRMLQWHTQVGIGDPRCTTSPYGKPGSSPACVTESQLEASLHHLLWHSHPHPHEDAQLVKQTEGSTAAAWPGAPFLFPVPTSPPWSPMGGGAGTEVSPQETLQAHSYHLGLSLNIFSGWWYHNHCHLTENTFYYFIKLRGCARHWAKLLTYSISFNPHKSHVRQHT